MTLKPFPIQVPFKPSRSPSGLSAVWTEENRSGLSIAGIGVKANSGLISISPLRSPVARRINLHYRGQLARARGQRRSNPGLVLLPLAFCRQLSLRASRSTHLPDAATSVTYRQKGDPAAFEHRSL